MSKTNLPSNPKRGSVALPVSPVELTLGSVAVVVVTLIIVALRLSSAA